MTGEVKARHERATWVGTLSILVQLAEGGYDFTTPEGKEVLEEARRSLDKIETALAAGQGAKT